MWPDRAGRFPWEDENPAPLFWRQRVLGPVDRWPNAWPFPVPPNVAAFTTRQVVREKQPIRLVTHDEDGAWQFHNGAPVSADDGMIVALEQMLLLQPSLADLGNLGPGVAGHADPGRGGVGALPVPGVNDVPAKNIYHDAVVEALKADGWTITADPLRITVGVRRLYVDLGAERSTLGAEKGNRRIAVEVQSFLGDSDIENLQHAVGQYVLYRVVLAHTEPDRVLYLAIPGSVYSGILSEQVGLIVVADLGIKLLVFDGATQRITQWTS
jgi:hypothetical protein